MVSSGGGGSGGEMIALFDKIMWSLVGRNAGSAATTTSSTAAAAAAAGSSPTSPHSPLPPSYVSFSAGGESPSRSL